MVVNSGTNCFYSIYFVLFFYANPFLLLRNGTLMPGTTKSKVQNRMKQMNKVFSKKVKVKLSLCLTNGLQRHEDVHIFLNSALAANEWSASRPGRFTSGERAPGTHWIGGWVNPRTGLNDVKRKCLTLPGLELRSLGRPACNQSLY
jgi:hypothetical protein